MYTITVNVYKYSQLKWQEQALLNASSKAEAKIEAQNLVNPYIAILTDICHKENLNGELFDWGIVKVIYKMYIEY